MSAAIPNPDSSDRTAHADCRDVASILGLGNSASGFFCPACQGRDQVGRPHLHVTATDVNCQHCGFEGDVVELVGEARGCGPQAARDWLRNDFAGFTADDEQEADEMGGSAAARELAAELGLDDDDDDDDDRPANLADELDFDEPETDTEPSSENIDIIDEVLEEIETNGGFELQEDLLDEHDAADAQEDDGLGLRNERPDAPVALGSRAIEEPEPPASGVGESIDGRDDQNDYDLADDSRTGVVDIKEIERAAQEVDPGGYGLEANNMDNAGATIAAGQNQSVMGQTGVDINALVDLPENRRGELLKNHILVEFLEACPEPGERLRKWLQGSGIISDVVRHLNLRTLPKNYLEVHEQIVGKYGKKTLLDSGLMVLRRGPRRDSPITQPAFRSFFNSDVRLLLIPYTRDQEPLFINALPMAPAKELQQKNLRPRRSTDENEPGMLNEDVLDVAEKVLICRGEFLTMIAMSMGFDAVGVSGWSRFRPQWISRFEGKKVMLVGPNNESAASSMAAFNKMFKDAGLKTPDVLLYEPGGSLVQFLRSQIPGSWVVDRLGDL